MLAARRHRRVYDAVVLGTGLNGLVAAAELAVTGWCVALVDTDDRPRTRRDGVGGPRLSHDDVSAWHSLFALGPAHATLRDELEDVGLRYRATDGPTTATLAADDTVVVERDPGASASALGHAQDASTYVSLLRSVEQQLPDALGGVGAGLAPDRLLTPTTTPRERLRDGDVLDVGRLATATARDLLTLPWSGSEVPRMWGPWLRWCGLEPEDPGSALALATLGYALHQVGLMVPVGGERRLRAALRDVLVARGVDIVGHSPATRVETNGSAVNAVQVGGRRLEVEGVVLAATSAGMLDRGLLGQSITSEHVPDTVGHPSGRLLARAHLDLGAQPHWHDDRLAVTPLLHVEGDGQSPDLTLVQPHPLESGPVGARPETLSVEWEMVGEADPTSAWPLVLRSLSRHAPDLSGAIRDVRFTRRRESPRRTVPVGYQSVPTWLPGVGSAYRTIIDGLFHVGGYGTPSSSRTRRVDDPGLMRSTPVSR